MVDSECKYILIESIFNKREWIKDKDIVILERNKKGVDKMHQADITMITNFFRVVILLILPLFIIDIVEFILTLARNWKKEIKKWKIFQKRIDN